MGEEIDLFTDARGEGLLGRSNTVGHHGKIIEIDNNHGQNSDALRIVNVAEQTSYQLLAFLVRKNGNEGMRCE